MTEAKKDSSSKKKPGKRKTKGETIEEVTQLLEQIEAAEDAVQEAEIELDSAKDIAKTAKGVWLTRVSELRELVRSRRRWAAEAKRQPLLHPEPDKAATLPDGAVSSKRIGMLRDVVRIDGKAGAVIGQEHTAYVDAKGDTFLLVDGNTIDLNPEDWTEIVDDKKPAQSSGEWRKFTIDRLAGDVTANDREKLAGANLLTFGDLQDRMQRDGTWWARDIKGIGEAGQTRIEDAFNAAISEAATS